MNQFENTVISEYSCKHAKAQKQIPTFNGIQLKLPTEIEVHCL